MINPADFNTTLYKLQESNVDKTKLPKNATDEKLKKAASDFEAVFIRQFMEVMDSTVEKSDFMHGGQAENTFRSMMFEQMANNIASNPATSFGFAEQIYKQMKDQIK